MTVTAPPAPSGSVSPDAPLSRHERLGDEDDTYYLNMGPQHPSMHGVLRLLLKLRGEQIIGAEPVIGYAHRAQEKMAELRTYQQFLPNSSRVDYLCGMIYNVAYCQAVEKLLGLQVPERAEHLRVIVSELNRISSHLLWFGTFLLDLGGITPFLYSFDDREEITDILERVTGSRLTYSYARFGGLCCDVGDDFAAQTRAFLARLRGRLPGYHKLVTNNVIFRNRCRDVGVIDRETALRYGVTGPCLRAAGVRSDLRRDEPYGIYDRFDFEVPVGERGDAYDRYLVRVEEMAQSCRIVEQALDALPGGPVIDERARKLRKLKPPAGELYYAVESARGHFGIYIHRDGGEQPSRLKLRTPSFSTLSALPAVLPNTMVADTIAIVGSIDIVLPEADR